MGCALTRLIEYALIAFLSLPTQSSAGNRPTEKGLNQIGVRNAHAMVFQDDRSRVLLFGGADASEVRGDTWEWDGSKWMRVSIYGPDPRTFPAMSYDLRRRRVVLFGGNKILFGRSPADNSYLEDTWEWDRRQWIQIKVPGPSQRSEAVMVFDEARGRSLLFGGHTINEKGRNWLGDTWEWDGRVWVNRNVNGPSPRSGAAAAYDRTRKKVVLFGGSTAQGVSGETWEWDGKSWVENKAAQVEGRFNSVMAYEQAHRRIIRFGGRFGGKAFGDTWQYNGHSWKKLTTVGPAARNHSSIAYDLIRQKILLFGGHDGENVFADSWEWNGNNWRIIEQGETKKHVDNGH